MHLESGGRGPRICCRQQQAWLLLLLLLLQAWLLLEGMLLPLLLWLLCQELLEGTLLLWLLWQGLLLQGLMEGHRLRKPCLLRKGLLQRLMDGLLQWQL